MAAKSTPEEAKEINRLISALEKFQELDAEMPLQMVMTFLQVARGQGENMSTVSQKVAMSQKSVSRHLIAFSKWNSTKKKPGHDLIEYTSDIYTDSRAKIASLNRDGRTLLNRVLAPWRK